MEAKTVKKSNLVKSISAVTGMTLISRILGFIRDILMASIFGASGTYDAFLVAFKIPNFMRRLFAEGAFSQAFIPVLAEYKTTSDDSKFYSSAVTALGTVVLSVVLLGIIAAPIFIYVFAPGYYFEPEKMHLASSLLRITFPYLFFIALCALMAGVLQINNKFALPAFSPVLLNISLIIAAVWLTKFFNLPIYALAWGVAGGGAAQLLMHIWALNKQGYKFRLDPYCWKHPGVKKILLLMLPALFGVSINQINILLDTVFASFLVSGSISWLYYADRLMELPLGLFGVGIATVLLPSLSKNFWQDKSQFSSDLLWSIELVLILGFPAAVGLYALATPLLATLFKVGQFGSHDVIMSSLALKAYAPGVIGLMLVKVLISGFYAQQEVKLPVKIAVFAMVINAILNLIFIRFLQHAGLALATSISALTHAIILFRYLIKRQDLIITSSFYISLIKISFACVIMFFIITNLAGAQDFWLESNIFDRVSWLSLILILASASYFLILKISGFSIKQLIR